MKKYTIGLLAGAALLLLSGCGGEKAVSGEIQGNVLRGLGGGKPYALEVEAPDGTLYGFRGNGDTEVVWEDEFLFEEFPDMMGAYQDWDMLGPCMEVAVVPGQEEEAPPEGSFTAEQWRYAEQITVTWVDPEMYSAEAAAGRSAKPVIYLYPEEETQVSVRLDHKGELTCAYPAYEDGWQVTARPDGTLVDREGQVYNYLYWEGDTQAVYDFSQGFCVKGEDAAAFLEEALAQLGLTRREANEFIVYWLPLLEGNPYNLIAFQGDAYTNSARLEVSPAPDTVLRVFMAWKPLEAPVEIPAQELEAPRRQGFTLVEWGGCQVE